MNRVELVDEVELAALFFRGQVVVPNVLNHLVHGRRLRVDARALENARQEGGLVILRAAGRAAAGPQRDEAGHVLVLGAQAVEGPRAERGLGKAERTGVHEHRRHVVRRDVGVQRAHHGHAVCVLRQVRKNLTELNARSALLGELERRAKRDTVATGDGLAVVLGKRGLWVPSVHVRGRALRENVDDALGFGGEVRGLGRERIEVVRRCGGTRLVAEHRYKAHRTHAHAEAGEPFAAREEEVRKLGLMFERVHSVSVCCHLGRQRSGTGFRSRCNTWALGELSEYKPEKAVGGSCFSKRLASAGFLHRWTSPQGNCGFAANDEALARCWACGAGRIRFPKTAVAKRSVLG